MVEVTYAKALEIAQRAHENARPTGGRYFMEEEGRVQDLLIAAAQEGYRAGIKALEAEFAKKDAAMVALRDDLLMRAEAQRHMNGGELVVEASNGVWIKFNDAIEALCPGAFTGATPGLRLVKGSGK